jgi:hypothetical protein
MNRIGRVNSGYYEEGYFFDCPGCGSMHVLPVRYSSVQAQQRGGNRPCWTFNGSLERPTFSPSLLVRWHHKCDGTQPRVCHSFIRSGQIQFLTDCTHALAGKTVDLPDIQD